MAGPLSGDTPVHLACRDTWLAERCVPAWKEMTNGHHKPGLLEDRGDLSLSQTLELPAAELQPSSMSSFLRVIALVSLGAKWRLHGLIPGMVWSVVFSH